MVFLRASVEVFRAALVDISRRPLFSGLSVLAMAVGILVLAAFLLLSRGAERVFAQLSAQSALEVYLRPDAAAAQIEELARRIAADPTVRSVSRVDAGRALADFREQYPDLGDLEALLGENPFSSSLRVVPREADAVAALRLQKWVKESPAVLSVRYDREWLQSIERFGGALRLFGWLGSTVLMLAALVTVGAVVRLALDDKLDEVVLLRLVGAPVSFVLAPVLIAGGLLGAAGAAAALVVVGVSRAAVLAWAQTTPLAALFQAALGAELPFDLGVLLAALGILAGVASAGLAAGRAALR